MAAAVGVAAKTIERELNVLSDIVRYVGLRRAATGKSLLIETTFLPYHRRINGGRNRLISYFTMIFLPRCIYIVPG